MGTKTALIAIEDPTVERELAAECQNLGLITERAHADPFSVMALITPLAPDVLLVDVSGAGGPALPLCGMLAEEYRLSRVPMVLLLPECDHDIANQAQRIGVHAIGPGPAARREINTLVNHLLEDQGPCRASAGRGQDAEWNGSQDSPRPRVLLIDDDPHFVRALQIKLAARGISVSCAFDGSQGFWAALRDRPDVIITDYIMPDGYGDYVIGRMQRHPLTAAIPIVVVTGRKSGGQVDYSVRRDLLGLGAAAVLAKPLDFEALLRELEKHVPAQRECVCDGDS